MKQTIMHSKSENEFEWQIPSHKQIRFALDCHSVARVELNWIQTLVRFSVFLILVDQQFVNFSNMYRFGVRVHLVQ